MIGSCQWRARLSPEYRRVEDGFEEPRSLARQDGVAAVSLLVRKQSGTNTVRVADTISERLEEIRAQLPPDIHADIIRDQSRFIKASVDAINEHLVIGGLLAAIVVLLFMRNFRSTIIAAVAVPISIIATFTAMLGLDMTLNNLTMLGLTLAVGIVIDDAIVVLENIYRYIEEEGYPPIRAAIAATQEIGLAVMATTLSLVVIFLPVVFLGGIPGRFLSSFGLTMAVSIMVSMFVSFTLHADVEFASSEDAVASTNRKTPASTASSIAPMGECSYGRSRIATSWSDSSSLRSWQSFPWSCSWERTSSRRTIRTNLKLSSRRPTAHRSQAPTRSCNISKEKLGNCAA